MKKLTRLLALLLCACQKQETLKLPDLPLDREVNEEDVSALLSCLTAPARILHVSQAVAAYVESGAHPALS